MRAGAGRLVRDERGRDTGGRGADTANSHSTLLRTRLEASMATAAQARRGWGLDHWVAFIVFSWIRPSTHRNSMDALCNDDPFKSLSRLNPVLNVLNPPPTSLKSWNYVVRTAAARPQRVTRDRTTALPAEPRVERSASPPVTVSRTSKVLPHWRAVISAAVISTAPTPDAAPAVHQHLADVGRCGWFSG